MTSASVDRLAVQPLDGVRVLDCSTRLSGAFAARLLADFGAEVVMVEGPSGHVLRHEPPFVGDPADPDRSALHAYANWNKWALVVDDGDRDALEKLVATADVIVTTGQPVPGHRSLELSITAHGLSGPLAGRPGNNLTTCARTGWSLMNAIDGEAPLQLPVHTTGYLAGIVGFTGAIAALRGRTPSSGRELVDVSEFEVMELTCGPWALGSVFRGVDTPHGPLGPRPRDRVGPLYPTADGHICMGFGDWRSWTEAMTLLGLDEFAHDEGLIPQFGRHHHDLSAVARRAAEAVATRSCWPLFHRLGELRCIAGCVHTIPTLVADPQLEARGFLVDTSVGGRPVRAPGWPARMEPGSWSFRVPAPDPAPAPGPEAGTTWRAPRPDPGAPHDATDAAPDSPTGPPLAGIRVLSFTQAWSGTLGTQLLAMLGADVVQIELLHKSDVWRNTRGTVPAGVHDPERRQIPQNTQGLYNSVNLGKRAIALDLSIDRGRRLFWELVPRFDVVVDNFAPHVMPNWGITLDSLQAVRPDIIFASISGYGSEGPYSRYPANGSTIEPMAGLSAVHGYERAGEDGSGAMTTSEAMNTGGLLPDPVAAFAFAASMVAAVNRRDRTGEAQRIDLSMMEAVALTLGDAIIEHEATGSVRQPSGNRHPLVAPHNMYRAGEEWVAIAAETDEAWQALAARIGDHVAADARFATALGRKRHETELDAIVGAWTANRDAEATAEDLGGVGVCAARATRGTEVFLRPDPHLRARGFLTTVEHPESGPNLLAGSPWRFDSRSAPPLRPAPGVGQHSREVLRTELGIGDAEYEALVAEGVTGTL
ncbi:MAG: CoA transferase [Acidimicrobiales bacterium]